MKFSRTCASAIPIHSRFEYSLLRVHCPVFVYKGAITLPNQVLATFAETKPVSAVLSLGREGYACPALRHTETGCPILSTYYTAVVIIKLKSTTNTYGVIPEARVR